jgi:hypothetical protein
MKKLPIGIQAFEIMRTQGYVYVDKTRHVHQMVDEGMFYFMARPRRFGKSLLVSTLKCLFQGKRELFEDLWIAEHGEWEWKAHPVVVIDFNGITHDTPEHLRLALEAYLTRMAEESQITLKSPFLVSKFRELIYELYRKSGMLVPVFIDEYDKPIIDHLGKGEKEQEIARANREILRSFFGVLKDATVSTALRFVFLTGVSRFSKVSLFSELNNLNDISMHVDYAAMLGYTQEELEVYFQDHTQRLARELGYSKDEMKATLAQQYDGYRFSERDVRVYNPFSILKAFNQRQLKNYWFETGTPTFLINLLRRRKYNLPQIEGLQVGRSIFTTFEIDRLIPEALLFQTGYLTITGVEDEIYTLDYPNREVKTAFTESLLFSEGLENGASSHVLRLSRYLQREEMEAFFETVTAIFASIPYDIEAKRDEAYFHALFYLMISASGGAAQSSVLTCRGRIDLVVTFSDKVYLIEFKCNQSAEAGIRQIQEKGYAEKYRQSDKKIILVGINFSTEKRNLEAWKVQVAGPSPLAGTRVDC